MDARWIFVFVFSIVNCGLICLAEEREFEKHNKAFDKILDYLQVKSHGLSVSVLDNLISRLIGRFKCSQITTPPANAGSCTKSMCLSGQDIFTALAIADGEELLDDHFGDLSNILLFHLLTIQNNCHGRVSVTQNTTYYHAQLALLLDREANNRIDFRNLRDILEDIHDIYDDDDHDDDDDHSEEHHDDDHSEEHHDDDKNDDMHDDHDDDRHEDNHDRLVMKKQTDDDDKNNNDDHNDEDNDKEDDKIDDHKDDAHDHIDDVKDHIDDVKDHIDDVMDHIDDVKDNKDDVKDHKDDADDHDDDTDSHKDDDDDHKDETDDHKDDDDDDRDDHDDDKDSHEYDDDHSDEDDDEDDNEIKSLATKRNCVSPGTFFDDLDIDPDIENDIDMDHLEDVSSSMIYYLLTGAKISDSCRELPRPSLLYHKITNDFLKVTEQHFTLSSFSDLYEAVIGDTMEDVVEMMVDDGHNHRRRRRAAEPLASDLKQFQKPRCYSADQLLAMHNVANGSAVPEQTIKDLCPSLLYLKAYDACKADPTEPMKVDSSPTDAERYGYGTLAVLIVCMCSLTGVFVLACSTNTSYYRGVMSVFIGLAVGTLVTDAVLHLLPTAFGLHLHTDDDHGHGHSETGVVVQDFVWYGLAALAGIYGFFLLEAIMAMLRGGNTQTGHEHSHMPPDMELRNGSKQNGSQSVLYSGDSKIDIRNAEDPDVYDIHRKKGWSSVAIMVIIGDSVHNLADGLAIGAAFTHSGTLGVATSIAVFCHELPHELGDFAILVKGGLSVKQAVVFNFLSSLTAFIGLYIGLTISTEVTVRQWIFAITAGLFIYIALADMVPEMVSSTVLERYHRLRYFFLNNLGILTGALILVLLSVYEERIKI